MKNFPHQYSELARFRDTLELVRDLQVRGDNVFDDGVLGYALARARIYQFRGDAPDLERRIEEEQRKPPGDQGARTAARESRRTLQLFGFLDANGALTEAGAALLQEAPGTENEIRIWRQAVVNIALADAQGNVSHPMRILLRILADRGPLPRIELALAFEAVDDSQGEYERVLSLLPVRDAIARGALAVTEHMLNNSVKILPALALHLGLVADRGDDLLAITEAGGMLLRSGFQFGDVAVTPAPANPPIRRRRVGPRKRLVQGRGGTTSAAQDFAALTPDEQAEAVRLRLERTTRHNDVVAQVAAAFRERFAVYEDPASYDALLVPRNHPADCYLLEVKTLDLDEVAQTNRAIGQLSWYLWAYVRPEYPDGIVHFGIVYDREPTDETCRFLESLGIGAYACNDLAISPCNGTAKRLISERIGVPGDYATPEGM